MYGSNSNNNNNNSSNDANEASHLYPQSEVETDDDVFIMTRPTTTTTNSRRRSSVSSLPDPTTITASMSTLGTTTTTMLRRSSLASTGTITSQQSISSVVGNGTMTEEEQEERRRNIKAIMSDKTLTQKEKSKKIQSLMDGRGQQQQQQQQQQFYNNNNNNMQIISNSNSIHTSLSNNNTNRRGSMGSYCSNASSVYASSMAQAAADAVCETIILYQNQQNQNQQQHAASSDCYSSNNHYNPNHERSFHTTQSCSYSYDDDDDDDDDDDNNEMAKVGTSSTKPPPTPDPQLGSYRQYHGRSKSLQDWTDSDRVTVAAQTTVFGTNNNQNKIQQVSRLMEQSRPACEHYERNCTIVSPCCGLAFGCRICHDECPALPPPIVFHHFDQQQQQRQQQHLPVRDSDISSTSAAIQNTTATTAATTNTTQIVRHTNKLERRRSLPTEFRTKEDDHHLIDRFAIVEVICRHCYTRQSSKSNKCINCSIVFGQYHCIICNLWMSDVESPYHCEDCGFCRVGGRNNFRHCNDCGMCIDTLLFEDHNCKSGKYMSNCPICQEDLFSSRFASHEMPCGHAIHWHCFTELTTYDSRCPVCKKTVESPERMEANWNAIAVGIALQPVPAEMARMVNILCNDCETITNNQRWHFLGVRCKHCFSFNTIVEQVVLQGRDAASYLDRLEYLNATQQQQQHNMGGVPTDISLPTLFIDPNIRNDDDSSDDTMSEEDGMEE